ncbi:hypothetical protein Poly30_45210 [Planctomycetes bacterium Poly30]|uniref:DUF1565 domain-containing protein n=2 Tax=Saltatorellus ferox TaxID=2528018 RepID=A0A518EXZ0_9BACT|nr:hypothetical protein Poly30_45210 [Planctomycetes bacterium Poly30]
MGAVVGSLLAGLASVPAAAQTFIIDDTPGAGVDFPSIQAALAVVPSGSVLDVRAGSYDGFLLDRHMTIIGESPGSVRVTSLVEIHGLGIGATTVLSRLTLENDVDVFDVGPTVLLDNLVFSWPAGTWAGDLTVQNSSDVRMARVQFPTLVVTDSRVQASASYFAGRDRNPYPGRGESGVRIEGAFLVHLDHCVAVGAEGDPCYDPGGCFMQQISAGSGGHGVEVGPHATLRAVRSNLVAGWYGTDDACACQFFLAVSGDPLVVEGRAELWDNQTDLGSPGSNYSPSYVVHPGGSADESVPYPSLSATNAGPQQTSITLAFDAEPGSSRRMIVGRQPVLAPIPGLTIGRLVTTHRLASLGESIQGSEQLSFPQPPWSLGVVFHAQVSRTMASGATELSNSISIVAR